MRMIPDPANRDRGASLLAHPTAVASLLLAFTTQLSELAADGCLAHGVDELAGGGHPWAAGLGLAAAVATPRLLAPLRGHLQARWRHWAEWRAPVASMRGAAATDQAIELVVTTGEAICLATAHVCLAAGSPEVGQRGVAGAALALTLALLLGGTSAAADDTSAAAMRAATCTARLTGLATTALALAPLVGAQVGASSVGQLAARLPAACESLEALYPLVVVAALAPKMRRQFINFRQAIDVPAP